FTDARADPTTYHSSIVTRAHALLGALCPVALQQSEDWRYVAAWGQWLVWTGTHWQHEGTLKVYDLARIVCREAAAACSIVKLKAKLASAGMVTAVQRL